MIRDVRLSDAKEICDIYNHYIRNTIITFEEREVDEKEIERRIISTLGSYPWLVYEDSEKLLGYAYAGKWKTRTAYKHSVEATVYVDKDYTGKGIGQKLLEMMIEELRKKEFHCMLAGIALPNDASIALHEKLGFVKIGQFKEVGFKFDKWIDVGYWEKIIYREV